jgi:hypothetical protein
MRLRLLLKLQNALCGGLSCRRRVARIAIDTGGLPRLTRLAGLPAFALLPRFTGLAWFTATRTRLISAYGGGFDARLIRRQYAFTLLQGGVIGSCLTGKSLGRAALAPTTAAVPAFARLTTLSALAWLAALSRLAPFARLASFAGFATFTGLACFTTLSAFATATIAATATIVTASAATLPVAGFSLIRASTLSTDLGACGFGRACRQGRSNFRFGSASEETEKATNESAGFCADGRDGCGGR